MGLGLGLGRALGSEVFQSLIVLYANELKAWVRVEVRVRASLEDGVRNRV